MNTMTLFFLLCTATALTALTWWGAAWWYGRKVSELQGKLDKTRKAAAQATAATRRQISQLQKELAARMNPGKDKGSAAPTPERDAAADLAARKQALLDDDTFDRTIRLPAHGFADTQPLI